MFPTSAHPDTVSCKCCGHSASLYDVCDFNKSCEDHKGLNLPLSGIPIYYYRCDHCGFIFTTDLDNASDAEFKQHIYNADYIKVDPEYEQIRPGINAKQLYQAFGPQLNELNILDYGGGNGLLTECLKASGATRAVSYDPFHDGQQNRPEGKFELVTSFEVVEHTPDPVATFEEMVSFMKPENSALLFSTSIQPDEIDQIKGYWWYIAPRNGHISIHSHSSLVLIMEKLGLKLFSHNHNIHMACRTLPDFAKHLIRTS